MATRTRKKETHGILPVGPPVEVAPRKGGDKKKKSSPR